MGQQLVITNFYKPNNVTIRDVMKYVHTAESDLIEVAPPSNKEIRLAIDLAKQMNPLFRIHVQEDEEETLHSIFVKENIDLIRRICKYNILEEKIISVAPFKQILYKEIIEGVKHIGNGQYKVKLKRVLRTHT